MIKTSITHPLHIDHVVPAGLAGRIGMTHCPGKHQPDGESGRWERDLDTDVAAAAASGASALVCLVESSELDALKVPRLGDAVRAAGLEFHHLPIADAGIPDARFETLWVWSGPRLRSLLAGGHDVVVHCKGGLGRTGMLAARLLAELGEDARDAVARVRQIRPGTIETQAQLDHALGAMSARSTASGSVPSWDERVLACMLGGAVGDALGYWVEFDGLEAIVRTHGPAGIEAPMVVDGHHRVSDDTQMTLFTLEALNDSLADGILGDVDGVSARMRSAYLDWLATQIQHAPAVPTVSRSRLLAARELYARRAPGNTCLSALQAGGHGSPEHVINDSKGCGGVMRVAPIGLAYRGVDASLAFELGARAAAVTHTHPSGYVAAGVMAAMVRELAGGRGLLDAADTALAIARGWQGHEETTSAVKRALALLADGNARDHRKSVASLGEGWVAEEALAIGIYCAGAGHDFPHTLRIAANHGGDSDSTASIAGQLYGACHGPAGLPHDWVARLDVLKPALAEVARLLNAYPSER